MSGTENTKKWDPSEHTFMPLPELSIRLPPLRPGSPAPRPRPYQPILVGPFVSSDDEKEEREGEGEGAPAATPAAAPAPTTAPIKVNGKWRCPNCAKAYKARHNLDRHMEKERGVRYKCSIPGCTSKPFSRLDSMPRHTATKHAGQAQRYVVVQAGDGEEEVGGEEEEDEE